MEVDADAGSPLVVPGAVGVSGEQTVRLGLIAAAVGQGQLQDLRARADVQVLLQRETWKKRERGTDEAERVHQEPERQRKDKQRGTELWVGGDNGIIALNYINMQPLTFFQSNLVCVLFSFFFSEAVIKYFCRRLSPH